MAIQKKKFQSEVQETFESVPRQKAGLTWEEKIRIKLGPVKYPQKCISSPRGTYSSEMKTTEGHCKYRGEWSSSGTKEGRGIETRLDDGSIYEGEFQNNLPNGYGRLISPQGTVYEGEWVDGKKEGHGRFDVLDQKIVYNGDWV